MSHAPKLQSQVSEHPSKDAVTRAADPKDVAADVDRKMRFYGVLQAFREGRYPTNQQIDDTLKFTIEASPVDLDKLSQEGQKLVEDVRNIIELARQIVQEKNANQEFQNFLFASRQADITSNVNVQSKVTGAEAKKDQESAGEAFRTLFKLFLRNGEVRKLVQDFGVIGRDIFADAATKAANVARPDEAKLGQVDQPAPDNQFHDDIPGEKAAKKAKQVIDETDTQKLKEDVKSEVAGHAQDVSNSVDQNASDEANKQALQGTAEEKANLAKDQIKQKANLLSSKIPDKHKDLIKQNANAASEYFQDKFPKERRDQFLFRLKKIVVELQRHRDYQDAMEYFLDAAERYQGHATDLHGQVENSATGVRGESNVAKAEQTFRTLIERFANGRPTQPILDAINQLYTDAKNDSELKGWFQQLDSYIRKCLQEPGFIMKDEANTQAIQLRDSGKKFFVAAEGRDTGKYVPHKDELFKQVEVFFKGMAEDPLNVKFGESWKRLVFDLFLDSDGKPSWKPQLWADIRDPILPQLLQHVGWVPVPRIEYSDKQVDIVIENLTVQAQNILPNILEVDAHNYFKISAYKQLGDVNKHAIKLTLSQIQTDMRDVHFFINKKAGFPRLKDSGTADVTLSGNGLSVTVHLEAGSSPTSRTKASSQPIFTVKSVKAKVDKLNFAIRDSKHDLLIKILRPLATSLIKKQIQKAAEQGIKDGLEKAELQLRDLRDSLEAAKANPDQKQMDILKQKLASKKDDAQSKTEKVGTFNLAISKRNSILPQYGHPDGWLNSVERAEGQSKATDGSQPEWHSPAFSIVNAPGTSSAAAAGAAAAATLGTSAAGSNGAAAASSGLPGAVVPGSTTGTTTGAVPANTNGTNEEVKQPVNPAYEAGKMV
ncbi:unnamed protein product [Tilletia controversa]|uniref:Uncharacterized protein n=1 Tax=Tilletia controversa TaxID=13291 RepID=A0A8X7SZ31_9BASI|nr:hypothetical protein CF328_g4717 [Tilletia controversa]KAE8252537.1 hypothetical protein A4X06_0g2120 [Tilletia controversa]CAD6931994.1 unnamed protein product [Tilletia controversa]